MSSQAGKGTENAVGDPKSRFSKETKWISYILSVFIATCLVSILIVVLIPAIRKARDKANLIQSAKNLKQIGYALKDYHNTYGQLPPAATYGKDGKPLLSWRVLILPFLGEQDLYSQFALDEPWDSPNNKPLLAKMPLVYAHPTKGKPKEPYGTCYQVFVGGGAVFEAEPNSKPLTLEQIQAGLGTSNTMLVVEAANPVPWTKPEDLPYGEDKPLPSLGGLYSQGSPQYILLVADGSVHSVSWGTPEEPIRMMIVWNRRLPE
jgi:Protein of unknown function (DUF1559)